MEIEVERMWGVKTTTVPVVTRVLGTIKKDMENYTNKILGNINIHELQKIALLSTATFSGAGPLHVETIFASQIPYFGHGCLERKSLAIKPVYLTY